MLISRSYQDQQRQLHIDREDYGTVSIAYAPIVSKLCERMNIQSILDYGCGKGRLFDNLQVEHEMRRQAYDPGIERYSKPPRS